MLRIIELLYYTPETNITLYVNYTEIKIKNNKINEIKIKTPKVSLSYNTY